MPQRRERSLPDFQRVQSATLPHKHHQQHKHANQDERQLEREQFARSLE